MPVEEKAKLVSGIFNYIKQSHDKAPKEHSAGHAPVHVLEPLPDHVDISRVLSKVEYLLPDKILNTIDVIYVKHLDDFEERDINAMYNFVLCLLYSFIFPGRLFVFSVLFVV